MKNVFFLFFTLLCFSSMYSQYGPELIENGDMSSPIGWNAINGSTINSGIATVVGNGDLNNNFDKWSLSQTNLEYKTKWEHTTYEIRFDARQISGSGNLQVSQRFTYIFNQSVTGTMTTYTVQFSGGSESGAGNDINFGGNIGDEFEIDNVSVREVLLGPVITFETDFETDQWGANGVNPPAGNFWEVDHGDPRTTDHPSAHISSGRNGTGRAIWLGSYNGDATRNELGRDEELSLGEHWMGFSIYRKNQMGNSRIIMQNRMIASGGSNTVNIISLRESGSQLYFSLPTDVTRVDQTLATLGTWNGAGTGTTSVFFDSPTEQWLDIVIHYKGAFGADYTGPDLTTLNNAMGYDLRTDGFIEIWVNGNKLVDHVGTTAYRYERSGGEITGAITPKIGPYWSSISVPPAGFDYYYDNYTICQGPECDFNSVDPSGSGANPTFNATISVDNVLISEAGSTPSTFTVSLDSANDTGNPITINYFVGGTATPIDDYSALSGSVSILNAQQSATITLTPVDDVDFENDETVILTLVSGSGYSIGSPNISTVTIVSDDPNPGENPGTTVTNNKSAFKMFYDY